MTSDLENRLFAAADQTVEAPDPGDFLQVIHRTLDRRKRAKQYAMVTASAAAVVLVTTVSLFLNLAGTNGQDYLVYDEFALFSDIGETETVDVDWVDPSLVLEALNYLIQEADFVENGWNTVETLDDLGYINIQPPLNSEG